MARTVSRKPTTALARKIRSLREEFLNAITQAALADLIGADQGQVSRWESGDDEPKIKYLAALANLANETIDQFIGHLSKVARNQGIKAVRVIGAVQAGQWRESVTWPDERQFGVDVPVPRLGAELYGLQVLGQSMNLVYPEGSIVVVLPTILSGTQPESGNMVVVERRSADGLYEATVKQFEDQGDIKLFWPRSDDRAYLQPIEIDSSLGHASDETVTVTGIVIASYRPERGFAFKGPTPRKGAPTNAREGHAS